MKTPAEKSALIKKLASDCGFNFCGIAAVRRLNEEEKKLETWLAKGFQGKMNYLENHYEMRLDPAKLVPGAKSVISLMVNYYPKQSQNEKLPRIAKYAYGEDYHKVIRKMLKTLFQQIIASLGSIEGRVFVDSAPVLERQWAAQAGLGWIGKHGLLITKKAGSFFFLAEIICDLDLEADVLQSDHCGSCTACIDACPTHAIVDNQLLDASRCISYLTIELKDEIPASFQNEMQGWIFGCDICQDVCPWNRFSKAHNNSGFDPLNPVMQFKERDWKDMSKELFAELFGKSALKRSGYNGLMRNIKFVYPEESST